MTLKKPTNNGRSKYPYKLETSLLLLKNLESSDESRMFGL